MPGYRLYFVDAAGHFAGSDEFEVADDRHAKVEAERRRAGHNAELWEQGRRVWVFDGTPAATNNPFSYSDVASTG
jgi:hypothetical protein